MYQLITSNSLLHQYNSFKYSLTWMYFPFTIYQLKEKQFLILHMYDVHFSKVIAARIGIISARFIDTKNFRDVNQNCSDLVGQLLSQSIQIHYCHLFIIIRLGVSNLFPTIWFMTFCFTSDLDKMRHNPTYFSQYQIKC